MAREKVTVQIMLGGKSTRMGRDKATVMLGGKTLLERALERWGDYGSAIQLSVGSADRVGLAPEGIPAVVDAFEGRGPIGGVIAGLRACRTEYLLLVAVDTPFVTPEMADALLEVAEEYGCDACTYIPDGQPQPLFSLYRVDCLPAAEKLHRLGLDRVSTILYEVYTERLVPKDKSVFRNLNTPEELAEAERSLL